LLRDGLRSGRIRLLVNEYDAEELLAEIGSYSKLSSPEMLALQMPYINTTLLIDEMVRLQHDESGGRIKLFERAGARKDRYSSLTYNYYVAIQLEAKAARRGRNTMGDESFIIKAPKYGGRTVNRGHGRSKAPGWSG